MSKKPKVASMEVPSLAQQALAGVLKEGRVGREKILTKLDGFEDRMQMMESRINNLYTAFPNGDPRGHCLYHELMIEEIADRKKLIKAVKEKAFSSLIWSGLVTLFLMAFAEAKRRLGIVS